MIIYDYQSHCATIKDGSGESDFAKQSVPKLFRSTGTFMSFGDDVIPGNPSGRRRYAYPLAGEV